MGKCSTVFYLIVCVVSYPVIVVESWVFDRDLTKGMHCIVASENLVLDRGLPYTHGKKNREHLN